MPYGIDAALIPVCTSAQWSSSSFRQSNTPHGRLTVTILLLLGGGLEALGLLTHLLHHHVDTHALTQSANRDNVKGYLDSHNAHLISPAL